ncbi:MAG: acetate--CoA ligase family protein [Candidatus Heimdallarchaeaceae archaeon]
MVHQIFYPRTIAVIGATSDPRKFGNAVTINILENEKLECKIFPVNPKAEEICGLKAYPSVLDIEDDVDLAIILVPAKAVPLVVDQCIEKKVKRIIIVSAGFGEINEEGKKIEQKIAEKCKEADIRVVGPNCVGIQNLDIGLNASFVKTPLEGNVSMVTQSGSFGAAILYEMWWQGLGFSKFANLGNMIDINLSDLLQYFTTDITTQVVCIYLENVIDGRKFYNHLKEVAKAKPVVLLKGGRTSTGSKAASSHTGSLATNYISLKAAVRQAGATLCENLFDYITAIKAFAFLPIPKGEKIGVLTNSGGSAVLFSDNVEELGLQLAQFSEDLKQKIDPHLIPLVKKTNPLDMIAGASEEQYYQVTKAMLEDQQIDIVVPIVVIPTFLEMKPDEHYRGALRAWNETGREKPIIPICMSGVLLGEVKELAKKEKAPIFLSPKEAAFAIKVLVDRMKKFQK